MKKFIILFLMFIMAIPVLASQWIQIFEKQYIDFETIEIYEKQKIIKFWVKTLRKDPNEKFLNLDYWYGLHKWSLNCNMKKSRIEAVTIYDLKQNLIYSDDEIPKWNTIIPDTYAEGYYRLFCLVPFNENPLLKK